MTKTRVVDAGFDCPKCGQPMLNQEVGITIAEQAEPVRWVVDKRMCSRGCLLVATDIPKEHGGPAE